MFNSCKANTVFFSLINARRKYYIRADIAGFIIRLSHVGIAVFTVIHLLVNMLVLVLKPWLGAWTPDIINFMPTTSTFASYKHDKEVP